MCVVPVRVGRRVRHDAVVARRRAQVFVRLDSRKSCPREIDGLGQLAGVSDGEIESA